MKLLPLLFLVTLSLNAQEENLNCSFNIQEALFYLKGNTNIEKDTLKAIDYLKPYVSIKHSQAQLLLGYLYVNNTKDEAITRKGFKLIKKSAKHDNAIAAQHLGVLYKYGTGCRLNYKKALKWFQKAYELGNDEGAYSLGYFYLKGLGDIPQNYNQAVYWFKKSNSDMAAYWLGICYLNGDGVIKDLNKANELLGTDFKEEQSKSVVVDTGANPVIDTLNTIETFEDEKFEDLTENTLYSTWTGHLLKKDWSNTRIEYQIPVVLTLSYDAEDAQTTYTWHIEDQTETGTAIFIDNSIYFDNLQINLPHQSYHEKIPSSLSYQILSSALSMTSFYNQRYLLGTLESYIPHWDEKGAPIGFVLTEESTTTENSMTIPEDILHALAAQKEHFIKLYPNPLVKDLVIAYTLEHAGNTKIQVSSLDGLQHFTVSENHKQNAGDYNYHFNGACLKKGIYIVTIYVDSTKNTRLIIKK